jgi:hypothetical protein
MPCYDKQLIDAKTDRGILAVTPVCADNPDFPAFINEVTRKLMRRGGWWGTEMLMSICATNSHITWPRIVGTVLGIRPCGRGSAEMRNMWWNIVGPAICCGISGLNGWGTPFVVEQNPAPCYNEISGNTGRVLYYHVTKAQDYGKTITIFGTRFGGQPLQELDTDGNWKAGITITAQPLPGGIGAAIAVTRITSIVREPTQGMSYLYELDENLNIFRDLAQYEPTETNPQYRRVKIQGYCGLTGFRDDNDRCIKRMEALVKLQFIPVANDADFLPIGNLDALKLAIQATRFDEGNDEVMARAKWDDAVKELNLELRDRFPNNQTSIVVNATSSDCTLVNAF